MAKILELDDYRGLHELLQREMGTATFVFAGKTDSNGLATYVPEGIGIDDLGMLITALNDRRNKILNEMGG